MNILGGISLINEFEEKFLLIGKILKISGSVVLSNSNFPLITSRLETDLAHLESSLPSLSCVVFKEFNSSTKVGE